MAYTTKNISTEWKVRRTRTFIGFIFETIALGMEYSLTFITLWLYLKEIKVEHMNLHYSLISAAYLTSQVVSSIIFGRIADSYRCIRELFVVCNLLVVAGNVLYTIPLSPWMLFLGRLISGGGGCLRCIMTGELARSYPEEELSSKFSLMGMAFGLGFIVGPGINFAFLKVDFHIGPLHVWYVNAPGLYLSVIFLILQLFTLAVVSNLSKEYDLKEDTAYKYQPLETLTSVEKEEFTKGCVDKGIGEEGNCDDESLINEDDKEETGLLVDDDSTPKAVGVLSKIFKNIDTTLILILSFFFMYCMVSFDLWQPRAVIDLNLWTVLEINIINCGYGIGSVLVLLLITIFPISDARIVYVSMVCTYSICSINAIFIAFTLLNNAILNIILWTLYVVFFALIVIMEEVFLIGVMAKMTSSRHQSFVESIRLSFSRGGALVALLSAAVSFQYLGYVCTGLAACGCVGILLIVWRKKQLQSPRVLIF